MQTIPNPMARLCTAAGLCLLAPVAWAHTGAGVASGLGAGLMHPLAGFDHLLAMLAVGIWAAQRSGPHPVALPSAFLFGMLGGGALVAAGLVLPGVELGIIGSLIVLGIAVAFAARLPMALAIGITAALGAFHGQAHVLELPAATSALAYVIGFIAATATLHGAGVWISCSLRRANAAGWLRSSGIVVAGVGALAFAGA